MKNIGARLKALRDSIGVSQAKMAEYLGTPQSSIHRYESSQAAPPCDILIRYADYFDISLDYLCGRTDKPQGILYENKPRLEGKDEDMREFIEMCFDPKSPMSERPRDMLFAMMQEDKK